MLLTVNESSTQVGQATGNQRLLQIQKYKTELSPGFTRVYVCMYTNNCM